MNKKIIRVFIVVCLMLAMTTTTAFAAPTEMVGASNVQVKSSSKEIHRTVRRHIYIDEKLLNITSNVTYHLVHDGYLEYYLITDVDVHLSGPMADECYDDTAMGWNGGKTYITTKDDKLIAVLEYTIYGIGKLRSKIKRIH